MFQRPSAQMFGGKMLSDAIEGSGKCSLKFGDIGNIDDIRETWSARNEGVQWIICLRERQNKYREF